MLEKYSMASLVHRLFLLCAESGNEPVHVQG